VHVLGLAGRDPAEYSDFTALQRTQIAIANLQQTGQTRGIIHNTFGLQPAVKSAQLEWQADGFLRVVADGNVIVLDPLRAEALEGADFVRPTRDERASPGNLITWSVDRVRGLPWFGDERMQWLKAIVFTGLDVANANFAQGTTSVDIKNELGDLGGSTEVPTFTDPEIGWPPAPMKPVISPNLPGEGSWIALDRDPFITQSPGSPAAFVTSFIRPNVRRADLRVYVTLWDPRQIALHMESGTVEPVSATGERGPGVIPRTPEVMRHVVAAFNGGFQAQHGEYGMQANRIMYLPPKPYGATVMEMRDGSTAFGTWPNSSAIPDEVLGYRQNLTALVEFDRFNPWGRTWWGGTPPGWADTIHTARSAVCLTKENFVAYIWSMSLSADDLGGALLAAGCSYGIHLDMNPGHAGFEFYNVMPTSETRPLGRPLQTDWEAEGTVSQMPGWSFRGRRMIKGMGHMNFPRYIHREGRDFFYLTRRTTLPGANIVVPGSSKDAAEGEWRVKGLPQHGFPYAIALTTLRAEPGKPLWRVLRVDPRTLRMGTATPAAAAADGTTPEAPTVLSFVGAEGRRGELGLYLHAGGFVIAKEPPSSDEAALVSGDRAAGGAKVGVGIHDETGMLHWVAPVDLAEGAEAGAILERLGCSTRMFVRGSVRALLGGTLDLAGNPATGSTATSSRLVRGNAPGAHLMFEDTALVPYSVWQPIQAKRVKMETTRPK
jgi:hypothetical protein